MSRIIPAATHGLNTIRTGPSQPGEISSCFTPQPMKKLPRTLLRVTIDTMAGVFHWRVWRVTALVSASKSSGARSLLLFLHELLTLGPERQVLASFLVQAPPVVPVEKRP